MSIKAFFNPLTGFSVMFPDQRSEDAARERMISAQRERTAADERMNERRANSQENVAKEYGSAKRYEATEDRKAREFTASQLLEREKIAVGHLTNGMRQQAVAAANRAEAQNDAAMEAYDLGVGMADEITQKISEAASKVKKETPGKFWKNVWPDKLTDEQFAEQVLNEKKRVAESELKALHPSVRKYITINVDTGKATFIGPKPKPFDRNEFLMKMYKDFGQQFKMGDDSEDPQAPGQATSQPSAQAQPKPTQAPFAAKQAQPGTYLMTFDGRTFVLKEDGTMQSIPRGMAKELGVPQDMYVPIPSRIIP